MVRTIIQAIVLLAAGCLSGCMRCKPPEPVPASPSGAKVYIVCEGAYGLGDASLSLYSKVSEDVYDDIYQSANGTALGDVLQSMTRIGDYYFLCINNSDKIAVINAGDWKLVTNISIPKPRYILPVSATKAYVSTLFSNKVYIINPQTMQVVGSISTPYQNPEGMLLADGKVIVCNWDTAAHSLTAIDMVSNAVTASIPLPNASPTDAVGDADGHIWVLSGNVTKGKAAMLTCLDATGALLRNYPLPPTADPLRLCTNAAKDTLYWIEADYNGGAANNGIYRMDIHSTSLPTSAFISAQSGQYFWAVGVDPASGHIYVGDPKGFVQRGTVGIYRQDGSQLRTFGVGKGPGHFYFEQ